VTALACGYLVTALFAAAAVMKVRRWADFKAELHDYTWIPARLEPVAAVLIPLAEAIAVVAFLVTPTRVLGSVLIAILLGAFSVALTVQMRIGEGALRCACFGRSHRRISWRLVWRNLVLAAPMVASAVAPVGGVKVPPAGAWIGACLAGAVVATFYEYAGLVTDLREA
jgi:hypothetical protein